MMIRKLLLATGLILVALMVAPGASAQLNPGLVTVDTVFVEPGQHFALPIRLSYNEINLGGIMVPLHYSSSALTVDSISFVGSFVIDPFHGVGYSEASEQYVQVTILPPLNEFDPIPSPNGLIASLYCTVAPGTLPGIIRIDSVNQEDPIWRKVHSTDESGTGFFLPDFAEGAVVVMESTDINDIETALPNSFELAQNYPNPFNPTTIIEFSLPRASQVKLTVFNVLGQEVEELVNRSMPAGAHQVEFDAGDQPSGIYFYRLSHTEGTVTKKMALVK